MSGRRLQEEQEQLAEVEAEARAELEAAQSVLAEAQQAVAVSADKVAQLNDSLKEAKVSIHGGGGCKVVSARAVAVRVCGDGGPWWEGGEEPQGFVKGCGFDGSQHACCSGLQHILHLHRGRLLLSPICCCTSIRLGWAETTAVAGEVSSRNLSITTVVLAQDDVGIA